MKKNIFLLLAATKIILPGIHADEGRPMVSFCQETESIAESPIQQTLQETRKKLSELAHNDLVVMKNFDNFAEVLHTAFQKEKSMTAQEIQKICSGIDFAAEKHRFQTRKNKERTPYISHPVGVAHYLMEIGEVREASVVIGALLHDTVEDTQTTFEEIENKFGKQVVGWVREVTDDKSLAKDVRKRFQVISASHKSKGAAQIKLADQLFNLKDLCSNPPPDWTQARVDRYFEWAQSVVDRLPNANDKLHDAVKETINQYWEKQIGLEMLVPKKSKT